MTLKTITQTENRQARAWFVKYPLDAYAHGPYRYDQPVTADHISDQALAQFGERPAEIWPVGPLDEIDEYKYKVEVPEYWDE